MTHAMPRVNAETPIGVPCRRCGAEAGTPCTTVAKPRSEYVRVLNYSHRTRWDDYSSSCWPRSESVWRWTNEATRTAPLVSRVRRFARMGDRPDVRLGSARARSRAHPRKFVWIVLHVERLDTVNKTSIEWTHRPGTTGMTWNPIRARLNICPGMTTKEGLVIPCGHRHDLAHKVCQHRTCHCTRKQTGTFCTRISPGCLHCYASTINVRFGNGLEFVVTNLSNIEFFIDQKILEEPLRRKKPATIFVGDMFDLFHSAISEAQISYVFATMTDAKQHTFQLLTKRADNMRRFIQKWGGGGGFEPNIWLGVSVESQKYADERIPLLLQTPAAVRFLSVEPMLEAVKLDDLPVPNQENVFQPYRYNCLLRRDDEHVYNKHEAIDWIICGGESGPGARPFNLAWAESLLAQCRAAGVPFFMKQVGTNPVGDHFPLVPYPTRGEKTNMRERRVVLDTKGGVMAEWPEHLRVREFPSPKLVTA